MDKRLKTRWGLLALGTVVLLFAGIIYAWSIIKAPFAEELGWSDSALTFNFTLTMCFFCLGGLVSGLLAKRLSVCVRLLIAAALVGGGLGLVSALGAGQLVLLYVGYGFMTGTGIGFVYNTVISAVNAYFPDRRGIASGALMMGFGFSTLLLGNIAVTMFDIDAIGWRTTYLILGLTLAAVFVIAALVLKMPPADLKFPTPVAKGSAGSEGEELTATQMLRRFSFWKLFVFFILFAAVGSTAIAGAKGQFEALGAGGAATLLAGLLTVCNGLGRIASGWLFDVLGLRKTQYVTSGVVILATALSLCGYALELTAVGVAGLLLCGFSYGFSPTMSSAFVSAFYGKKNFGLNFPILNLILIPASFVPTLMSGMSLTVTFGVLVAFSVVGLIINASIRRA